MAPDLAKKLTDFVAPFVERSKLAQAFNWEGYAAEHIAAFQNLLGEKITVKEFQGERKEQYARIHLHRQEQARNDFITQHVGNSVIKCAVCKERMWRKPQMPRVNWNGLPPHKEIHNPVIQEMIHGAPRRRDEYLSKHE